MDKEIRWKGFAMKRQRGSACSVIPVFSEVRNLTLCQGWGLKSMTCLDCLLGKWEVNMTRNEYIFSVCWSIEDPSLQLRVNGASVRWVNQCDYMLFSLVAHGSEQDIEK
jgi:hypothetical protein